MSGSKIMQIAVGALMCLGLAGQVQADVGVSVGVGLPGGGYIQAGNRPAYPYYPAPLIAAPYYAQPVIMAPVYRPRYYAPGYYAPGYYRHGYYAPRYYNRYQRPYYR